MEGGLSRLATRDLSEIRPTSLNLSIIEGSVQGVSETVINVSPGGGRKASRIHDPLLELLLDAGGRVSYLGVPSKPQSKTYKETRQYRHRGRCEVGGDRRIALFATTLCFVPLFLLLSADVTWTILPSSPSKIYLDGCADLTKPGVYVLMRDVDGLLRDKNYCISVQSDNVVIDGSGHKLSHYRGYGVLIQGVSNVVVRNLSIIGYDNALVIYDSKNVTFSNSLVSQFYALGVIVRESRVVVLRDNTFLVDGIGSCGAIRIERSVGSEVSNNTITFIVGTSYSARRDGCAQLYVIDLDRSNRSLVRENVITLKGGKGREYWGVVLRGPSNGNVVESNSITSPSLGILLQDSRYSVVSWNSIEKARVGILASKSSHCALIGNTVAMGREYGLRAVDTNHSLVIGNSLSSNQVGVSLERCHNITAVGNVISKSLSVGLRIEGSSGNTIYANTIATSAHAGILLKGSTNNTIYNNLLYNDINVLLEDISPNSWSTQLQEGQNVLMGRWLGGNAWLKPDGTGVSQRCADEEEPAGICDEAYYLAENNVDYHPLSANISIHADLQTLTPSIVPITEDLVFRFRLSAVVALAILTIIVHEIQRPRAFTATHAIYAFLGMLALALATLSVTRIIQSAGQPCPHVTSDSGCLLTPFGSPEEMRLLSLAIIMLTIVPFLLAHFSMKRRRTLKTVIRRKKGRRNIGKV